MLSFFYFLFCCGIIHKQKPPKFWQSPPLLVPVHVPVLNYRVLFFVCSDNLVHVLVSNDLPTKVAKLSDILVLTRCCSTLLHAAAYQNMNLYQMEPLHGCPGWASWRCPSSNHYFSARVLIATRWLFCKVFYGFIRDKNFMIPSVLKGDLQNYSDVTCVLPVNLWRQECLIISWNFLPFLSSLVAWLGWVIMM